MRAALTFLIVAAIAVAVAWAVSLLPGTVAIQLGDLAFETSTPVAVLLAAILFILLYILFRLLGAVLRGPRRLRRWRAGRARARGDAAVTRAFIALAAGDASAARREAERARANLGNQPVALLLVAGAGKLAGREGEATAAYRALAAQPEAAFLGLRGLLRQAVERGDLVAAADLARQAENVQPGAAWLKTERLQIALRTGAWADALRLAPTNQPEPRAALAAAVAESTANPGEARRLAKSAWEADPKLVPAALTYARRLRELARESVGQDVLRRTWAVVPHPDLAALALEPVGSRIERVRAGQRFVQNAPDLPDSHLLLARLSLDAGLTRRGATPSRCGRGRWPAPAPALRAQGRPCRGRGRRRRRPARRCATPPWPSPIPSGVARNAARSNPPGARSARPAARRAASPGRRRARRDSGRLRVCWRRRRTPRCSPRSLNLVRLQRRRVEQLLGREQP